MGNRLTAFSFSLFARPSFLSGLGRLVDFSGSLNQYNYSLHPEDADYRALMSDWYAIGQDLRAAEEKVKNVERTASA